MLWPQPNKPAEKKGMNLTWSQIQFLCGLLASNHYRECRSVCQALLRSKESGPPVWLPARSSPISSTHLWSHRPASSLHAGSSFPALTDAPPAPFSSFSAPEQSPQISLNSHLLWQVLLTHIIRTASILFQFFYMAWWRKKEGHFLLPSAKS